MQSSQPKPHEKGRLVAVAEKSSVPAKAAMLQRSHASSQDRDSPAASQERDRQASSSGFELLGSQEILSKLSQLSNAEPEKPETLGIMSVPETETSLPLLPNELPFDTLAQDCSDIIKRLKPAKKSSTLKDGKHEGQIQPIKPKFKAVPTKKVGALPNVNKLLGNLKPVGNGEVSSGSCPKPTPTKKKGSSMKAKTPTKKSAKVSTILKNDKCGPKNSSFIQSSSSGKFEQSFDDIFDSIITQSIFTSESQSKLDLSADQSQADKNPDQSKIEAAPRKRKIAKKPKSAKSSSNPATKRKLNLKGNTDFLSKPPTKKVRSVSCDETKSALLKLQGLRTCGTWAMCTRAECGKWRHLALKDPAEVKEFFTCRDNPDTRYDSCAAPEQLWSSSRDVLSRMVETRFTVGSLVWAKMAGWPAWPAMVDDDPDTGVFFWTEMVEDRWMDKPNSYHVIFFDKEVSRSWVSNSSIRKFDRIKPVTAKTALGSRLAKAYEEAVSASEQSVTVRRKQHCLAAKYKGPWGPVWPGCGEEERGFEDESDHLNMEQISQEIRSQPQDERNMSFIDKSFNFDVMDTVDSVLNNNFELPMIVAKKSKPKSPEARKFSVPKTKTPKKLSRKDDKENVEPVSAVSHLYQDKDVFTAEMTEKIAEPVVGLSVSFHDNEDLLNSSLGRQVDSVLQQTNLFTPVKRTHLGLLDKARVSPGVPMTSSTPVRQMKPLLGSRDGDVGGMDDDKAQVEEADILDHSSAFCEDGQ